MIASISGSLLKESSGWLFKGVDVSTNQQEGAQVRSLWLPTQAPEPGGVAQLSSMELYTPPPSLRRGGRIPDAY